MTDIRPTPRRRGLLSIRTDFPLPPGGCPKGAIIGGVVLLLGIVRVYKIARRQPLGR